MMMIHIIGDMYGSDDMMHITGGVYGSDDDDATYHASHCHLYSHAFICKMPYLPASWKLLPSAACPSYPGCREMRL